MTRKILTAVTLAATVLASASVAEAGKRGGKHFHGGHGGGYGYGHGWNDYHGYEPAYSCHYYFKKLRYTGSPYWLKKYRRCISRY